MKIGIFGFCVTFQNKISRNYNKNIYCSKKRTILVGAAAARLFNNIGNVDSIVLGHWIENWFFVSHQIFRRVEFRQKAISHDDDAVVVDDRLEPVRIVEKRFKLLNLTL